MNAPRSAKLLAAVLVACLLCGPCLAQSTAPQDPREKLRDVMDKWIINGGNIGGAIGAVVGQAAFAAVMPGATSMVIGSFVGNQIGQLIGEYVDNKCYKSYNYVAFNRPALGEPGSVWLENAGPWEQALYQVDRWCISGGTMASLATHFAINAAAAAVPGAAVLATPVVNILADYIAGCLGDNLDGMIDLGGIGRKIDQATGQTGKARAAPSVAAPAITGPQAPATTVSQAPEATDPVSVSSGATAREAYLELQKALAGNDREAARAALERYRRATTPASR